MTAPKIPNLHNKGNKHIFSLLRVSNQQPLTCIQMFVLVMLHFEDRFLRKSHKICFASNFKFKMILKS